MKRLILLTVIFFTGCSYVYSEDATSSSYVDSATQITLIDDVNRQAEAWGTCSATWTIMANLANEGSDTRNDVFREGGGLWFGVLF